MSFLCDNFCILYLRLFSITSEKSNYQITPTTFIVLSNSTTHMFCPSVRPLCSFASRGILVELGNKRKSGRFVDKTGF